MTCDAILRRRASKRAAASSKRENAACAPRERQRFELIGRFRGCAYACASSEITGTLRALSTWAETKPQSPNRVIHAGVRDATQGAGDEASSGVGRAAVSVAGLPSARLHSALLLLPAPLAGELSPLPVVSPAPLRQRTASHWPDRSSA